MQPIHDAIIIGAGVAGLTLASKLRALNKTFLTLEKSAGVGGRIATRRGDDCAFDHGAQFIKIKPQEGPSLPGFTEIKNKGKVWFSQDGTDYFAFPKGMTQFPKSLAQSPELRLNEKVTSLRMQDDVGVVETEKGELFQAHQIFVTCPLPQALQLLKISKIEYPQHLDDITYASALVGLFRVQTTDPAILNISYLQDVSKDIFSVSNQLSKEVSQNLAFTVVMHPAWSGTYFESDATETLTKITEHFLNVLKKRAPSASLEILTSQLKKWRYSHPLTTVGSAYLSLENQKIILLGDAFGGGSVTGAIKSASLVPTSVGSL